MFIRNWLQFFIPGKNSNSHELYLQFRTILNYSETSIFGLDLKRSIIYANPAGLKNFGYEEQQLVGTDFFHLLNLQKNTQIENLRDQSYETQGIRKDKTLFQVNVTIRKSGNHYIAFIEDTAKQNPDKFELINANENLKKLQERYELALKGSSMGIWDWNLKTNELYASPICLEMLGIPKEVFDCRFSTFIDHLHPDDIERVMQAVKNHLEKQAEYTIDYRLHNHTTGKYHWIHARGQASWDDEGNPDRMAGSIRDITETKQFEAALKENKEGLEYLHKIGAMLNMSVHDKIDALLEKCRQKTDTDVAFFGKIEKGLFLIKNAFSPDKSLIPNDFFEPSESPAGPILETKAIVNVDDIPNTIWNKQPFFQKHRVQSYIGIPVFVKDKLYGAMGFYRINKTELNPTKKELSYLKIVASKIEKEITIALYEQTLKNEKTRAEKASRAKTEFLQNMSHEIRTPMNGIMGLSYLLMETPLTDRQIKYIKGIISSSEDLLTIINDILDLSRIEKGKLSLEKKSFDLKDVIENVVKHASFKMQGKNLALHTAYDPKAPHNFIGDSNRIRQILDNFVSNSIKFTHEGSISINVELLDSTGSFAELKVFVEDTGIGIEEEKLSSIFQKFVQSDSSSSRRYGGLGIGLAICKDLVDQLQGKIGVDSSPGKGSTFWFAVKFQLDNKNHQ